MGSSTTLSRILTAGAVAAAVTLGLGSATAHAAGACSDTSVLVKGAFGEARFSVELADDPAERAQGLMHRESIKQACVLDEEYNDST